MAAVEDVPMRLAPASIMASAFSADADPAAGLDPEVGADGGPHQPHRLDGGAAGGGVEPGRRLDEVGARGDRGVAGGDDLVVGEQAGLDDDLEHGRMGGGRPDGLDLGPDAAPRAGLGQAQVDDHVHLVRPVGARQCRLGRLGRGVVGARGEPDHRTR